MRKAWAMWWAIPLTDHPNGVVHTSQTSQGVAEHHQGVDVLGIADQYLSSPILGLLEETSIHQQATRLDLRFGAVGQEVGGSHVLGKRRAHVALATLGVGQSKARQAELRVDLQRPLVLNGGLRVLLLRKVGVTARKGAILQRYWIASACRSEKAGPKKGVTGRQARVR